MVADRTTLARFLVEARNGSRDHQGLSSVVLDVARACRAVADRVAHARLGGVHGCDDRGGAGPRSAPRLDAVARQLLLRLDDWNERVIGVSCSRTVGALTALRRLGADTGRTSTSPRAASSRSSRTRWTATTFGRGSCTPAPR